MRYEITDSPGFTKLDLYLNADESILAQPNSMLCMTTGIEISARIGGNLEKQGMTAGVKSMLSGESFATAVYSAKRDGVCLTLAPSAIGEIIPLTLDGSKSFYLTKGAYFAHQPGIVLNTKFGGFKGWAAKKGLFLLHASGTGTLFIASYGAVLLRELQAEEILVVDNEYVLAFAETVKYQLVTASKGLVNSMMSGEGLVNKYTGPGILYYQTRSRQKGPGIVSSLIGFGT